MIGLKKNIWIFIMVFCWCAITPMYHICWCAITACLHFVHVACWDFHLCWRITCFGSFLVILHLGRSQCIYIRPPPLCFLGLFSISLCVLLQFFDSCILFSPVTPLLSPRALKNPFRGPLGSLLPTEGYFCLAPYIVFELLHTYVD